MGLRSRRELMSGGLGLGAVSAVFGPGIQPFRSSGSPLAARQRDQRVLETLMTGELLLQYCYTQVLEAKALKTASTNVVLVAFGHEQSHAQAIQAALKSVKAQIAGLQTSQAAPSTNPAQRPHAFPPQQIVQLFQHLHHEAFCIIQLIKVEAYVQGLYFHAVGELSDPGLVLTATEILGCKAQQWSLFQDLLSHGKVMHTVPSPSVRGSATLPK